MLSLLYLKRAATGVFYLNCKLFQALLISPSSKGSLFYRSLRGRQSGSFKHNGGRWRASAKGQERGKDARGANAEAYVPGLGVPGLGPGWAWRVLTGPACGAAGRRDQPGCQGPTRHGGSLQGWDMGQHVEGQADGSRQCCARPAHSGPRAVGIGARPAGQSDCNIGQGLPSRRTFNRKHGLLCVARPMLR